MYALLLPLRQIGASSARYGPAWWRGQRVGAGPGQWAACTALHCTNSTTAAAVARRPVLRSSALRSLALPPHEARPPRRGAARPVALACAPRGEIMSGSLKWGASLGGGHSEGCVAGPGWAGRGAHLLELGPYHYYQGERTGGRV